MPRTAIRLSTYGTHNNPVKVVIATNDVISGFMVGFSWFWELLGQAGARHGAPQRKSVAGVQCGQLAHRIDCQEVRQPLFAFGQADDLAVEIPYAKVRDHSVAFLDELHRDLPPQSARA